MVDKYRLTSEGLLMAWVATCEEAGKELTIKEAFRFATKGKSFPQFILACICVVVCYPIGICLRQV